MQSSRAISAATRRRLVAFALSACAVSCTVTVPRETQYWSRQGKMMQFRYEQLRPVQGTTTREDVLREMGPPQYRTDDRAVMSYLWEVVPYEKKLPDWGNVDPPEGRPVTSLRRFVLLEFDAKGVLEKLTERDLDISDTTTSRSLFDEAVAVRRASAGAQ